MVSPGDNYVGGDRMKFAAVGPALYVRNDMEGARARFLLAVKDAAFQSVMLEEQTLFDQLTDINPDGHYPLLADRKLIVYGHALDDYIHERWPGPSLIPGDPAQRAQLRVLEQQIRAWYRLPPVEQMDALHEVADAYEGTEWFLGRNISVVDVALAPLFDALPTAPFPPLFRAYAMRVVAAMNEAFKSGPARVYVNIAA